VLTLFLVAAHAGAILVASLAKREVRAGPVTGHPRNVVLIFLDTLRYDSSGLAPGSAADAPSLAAFASKGVVFDAASSPAPWTVPSHLSIVAGLPANRLPIDYVHQVLPDVPTLATIFRARGYSTGAIFSNYLLTSGTGIARGVERFEMPERALDIDRTAFGAFLRELSHRDPPWSEWYAPQVTRRALRFLSSAKPPYFLMLNYADPHDPYVNGCGCTGCPRFEFRSDLPVIAGAVPNPSPEERRHLVDVYRSAIRCMDSSMGELLRRIEPSVDRGETVVAIVADHGEQFGEHGLFLHGNSLYYQLLHVPMLIRGAGLPAGRQTGPVSTTALRDMILRLSDMADPQPDLRQIAARYPLVARHDPPPRMEGQRSLLQLQSGPLTLITGEGVLELYDLAADPVQARNLASDPRVRGVEVALLTQLRRLARERMVLSTSDPNFSGLGYLH
jgi:arylsulfatase A-like enzyme